MAGIQLTTSTKDDSSDVDIDKCIICQRNTDQALTSNEQGRKRILDASGIRDDTVTKRLKSLDSDESFAYHMSNECYKKYTLKKTLEKLAQKSSVQESKEPVSRQTRSSSTSRLPPSSDVDIYRQVCVICGHKKHKGTYKKFRISEYDRAAKLLKASVFFQDSTYVRMCDLQDPEAVFGADLYYHKHCCSSYLQQYEHALQKEHSDKSKTSDKLCAFAAMLEQISPELRNGKGYALSDLRIQANGLLNTQDKTFSNRELKLLLLNEFGDDICFSSSREVNKSAMVFLSTVSAEEMADKIRSTDHIRTCAESLRNVLLETDLGLQDKFCDANELEQAWNNITIPEPVLTFLSSLCNVNKTHIQGSDLLSDQAEGDGELPDSDTTTLSQAKMRKVMALFQIKPGYSHGWIYLKKNPFLQPVIPNQYHHGVRSIPLLLRKTSQERLLGSYF